MVQHRAGQCCRHRKPRYRLAGHSGVRHAPPHQARSLFVWQPVADQPRTHFSKRWCSSRLSPLGLRTATSGAGSDSSLCGWEWDLLGHGGFARRIPDTQLRRQRFRWGFPVCRGCSRGSQCRSPHPEPASLVFVEERELPEGVMWLRHDHCPHSGSGRRGGRGERERSEGTAGLTESEASPRIGQLVRKE